VGVKQKNARGVVKTGNWAARVVVDNQLTGLAPDNFLRRVLDLLMLTAAWNQHRNTLLIELSQVPKVPESVIAFDLLIPIRIFRFQQPDTTLQVRLSDLAQRYAYPMPDSILGFELDPDRWLLREIASVSRDTRLVVGRDTDHRNSPPALYPNPTTGTVTVRFGPPYRGPLTDHDCLGRTLRTQTLDSVTETTLDLSTYPKGIYSVRTTAGSLRVVRH
jgi:hypothetical protein